MSALSNVQILASPSAVHAYGQAVALLPRLRNLCETSEKWIGLDSKDDRMTARALREVMSELTELMWATEGRAPPRDEDAGEVRRYAVPRAVLCISEYGRAHGDMHSRVRSYAHPNAGGAE